VTILIVVVVVVVALALWLELREWRRPRARGGVEGPDEMRQHIEHDAELGHSWRSGYRRDVDRRQR
jgi:hypothetical protein